ncbi:bifunctional transcriptional activator/DNA repair enzyme AdaA [Paenibacillus sp. D2_2]|uniref:bifunctional transcriptional activator/DNA repair enzyme AdaA n=1 Tax=Paenibacillus sp. D2_2 TaxID=3073092 RepID=UPI0028156BAF|nr:bifunctional transcriptional activator/DNA repair enzyme AdaA [Paenibacillus sp. D2_2]WMT43437.1 bifunctional transcriptional activator/DNA repair enzyme AdaA [Paenibacillus sp. D2_2]
MHHHPIELTHQRWNAIVYNDPTYDGKFFYAVKTTGIFCRPSCKSRPPKMENIRLFETAEQALSENFRPCKRCRPTGQRLPDDEWIQVVTDYIDNNYDASLTLQTLADASHGSPYHLHRTFKKIKGVTPVEYIQQVRITKAKLLLLHSGLEVAKVGASVGMANTAYFITLFKKRTGITPAQYRKEHASIPYEGDDLL